MAAASGLSDREARVEHGKLAHTVEAASRLAYAVTVFAAVSVVVLVVWPVRAGAVECGRLAVYPTVEYVLNEQQLPPAIADCGPALDRQATAADAAQVVAAVALLGAIALSLASAPLRRVSVAISGARRRRRIAEMQLGSDIEVDLPGDDKHREIGRVVQTLDPADEFDVSVVFADADTTTLHPYRYRELKPVPRSYSR